MVEKFDGMCLRLDTIPQCDGQTDRRTEMIKHYRRLMRVKVNT